MTATKKKFDLNGYGNSTAIGGTAFKLRLHIIVQKPREGSVKWTAATRPTVAVVEKYFEKHCNYWDHV